MYEVCLKSKCTDFLFKCLFDSPEIASDLLQSMTVYFLLCVFQHYMFRPSVWAIIRCVWRLSHTISWRRGRGVCVGGEISLCWFSYYVMHYVILVLILLMLRWHEVFRASAYMIKLLILGTLVLF